MIAFRTQKNIQVNWKSDFYCWRCMLTVLNVISYLRMYTVHCTHTNEPIRVYVIKSVGATFIEHTVPHAINAQTYYYFNVSRPVSFWFCPIRFQQENWRACYTRRHFWIWNDFDAIFFLKIFSFWVKFQATTPLASIFVALHHNVTGAEPSQEVPRFV